MGWYAAHIIQYARFKDGRQDTYPCYENIVLLDAASISSAQEEAARIGREHCGPGSAGGFLWEDRHLPTGFLLECANSSHASIRTRERLTFWSRVRDQGMGPR